MVKRYSDWHHLTLRGDRDLARSYVPLGRKLLGAIAQEMETTGNGQGKRTHRAGDGTVIVAQIIGAIPTLTITAPARPAKPDQIDLGGFVVWPDGEDYAALSRDLPELVLVPTRAGYKVGHSDADNIPAGLSSRSYLPLFPAPDGLKQSGNIDWTNASETLSVSWYGPRSRYLEPEGVAGFLGGATLRGRVYAHGQLLFDARGPAAAALLGDNAAVVTGAALRRTDTGLVLLAVVATDSNHDWVLAVDVVGTADTTILTVDLDTLRLLGDRSRPGSEYDRYLHPFFFNPDATEARCIRDDANRRVEVILTVDEAVELATFGEAYHPYPALAGATVLVDHVSNAINNRSLVVPDITYTPSPAPGSPNTYTINGTQVRNLPIWYSDPSILFLPRFFIDSTMNSTETCGFLVQAVDYRPDGTVVYLQTQEPQVEQSGTAEGTYVMNGGDATLTCSAMSDGDAVSPGGELNGPKASVAGTLTINTTTTQSWTNNESSIQTLRFGGGDFEYDVVLTGAYTETQTSSGAGTANNSFSDSFDTSLMIGGPGPGDAAFYDALTYSYAIGGYHLLASPEVDAAAVDCQLTLSGSCAGSRVTETLVLLYADLRHDCVVYLRERDTRTLAGSYSNTTTNTDITTKGATTKVHSIPCTITTVRLRTLVVRQRDAVLFEHNYSLPTEVLTPLRSYTQSIHISPVGEFFNSTSPGLTGGYVDTLTPLHDTLFNTGAVSFARTGINQLGAHTFSSVWPFFPTLTDYSPPPDPEETGDSTSGSDAVNVLVDTLYGQMAVGTKDTWPINDGPTDFANWRGYGAWAFYKDRYCFSCPAPTDGFGAGWHTQLARTEFMSDVILLHRSAHPIWVLPAVRGLLPGGPP